MSNMKRKSHIGEIYDGRWEYIGKYTFKNIYNGKTFTTNNANVSHIFSGRTTISNLLAYAANGGRFSSQKWKIQTYAIKNKRRIVE